MAARWPPGCAGPRICTDSGRRWRGHLVPEVLPRRERSCLGRSLPPAAGPGGSGDSRPGPPCVLLRHRHQAHQRAPRGPEAEATSGTDHHRLGGLLLPVLAALWSGHLRGRPAAAGGAASQLQAGSRAGRVASCGWDHGVCSLLSEPAAVRLPWRRVQEFSSQSPHAESGLKSEESATQTSRNLNHHWVRVIQFTFQLVFAWTINVYIMYICMCVCVLGHLHKTRKKQCAGTWLVFSCK